MVRSRGRQGQRQIGTRIVTTWTATVLSLWAAYWAALFAQVAHLRMLDGGVGALAFGWLAGALLAAGTSFFVTTIGA